MDTVHGLLASGSNANQRNPRRVRCKGVGKSRTALWPDFPRTQSGVHERFWQGCSDAWYGKTNWPLVLAGSIGCGKTCAALAISDYVAMPMMIETEDSLQKLLSAAIAKSHERYRCERDVWDAWANANLVILDDLGARRETNASNDLVYDAINYREFKPLIITTNLTPAEIEKKYGDRIASRIECGTVVEAFDLEDRR